MHVRHTTCLTLTQLINYRTNHLSAVFTELPHLIPITGIPFNPTKPHSYPSSTSVRDSHLLIPFAISSGFNETLVHIFHELGFLYDILDSFTVRLLPFFRQGFLDLVDAIERGCEEFVDPNPRRVSNLELMGLKKVSH